MFNIYLSLSLFFFVCSSRTNSFSIDKRQHLKEPHHNLDSWKKNLIFGREWVVCDRKHYDIV